MNEKREPTQTLLFGDINVATQSDEHTCLSPTCGGDPEDVGESDAPDDGSPHPWG